MHKSAASTGFITPCILNQQLPLKKLSPAATKERGPTPALTRRPATVGDEGQGVGKSKSLDPPK